jgi:hypothetical protein
LLVAMLMGTALLAQEPARRLEFGINTTMLRTLGVTDICAACPWAHWGAGPAVTYNLNSRFAIDGTFSFLQSSGLNLSALVGGNVIQGLAGLKATARGRKFSMFAKARPGFVRWSDGRWTNMQFSPGNPLPAITTGPRTNFVADFGGGIELAVSKNVTVRTEMSDLAMWWHSYGGTFDTNYGFVANVSNNLQISNSVRYHFGRTLETEHRGERSKTHRFFDKTNMALWGVTLLADSADMITTRRFMKNCERHSPMPDDPNFGCAQMESNPIARPFVKHGWAGMISLSAITNGLQITAAYGLHKLGAHKAERVLPLPGAIASGVLAYKNSQLQATWPTPEP